MKTDIIDYSHKVINCFTLGHAKSVRIVEKKRDEFDKLLNNIIRLSQYYTIDNYDLDILFDGEYISVSFDFDFLNEDIQTSGFVELLKNCVRFEIHPSTSSNVKFTFSGIWEHNE